MMNDVEVYFYKYKFYHFLFLHIDINECLSNPCSNTMKCENTPGSFQCIEGCEFGYIWSIKYGQCRDIDECALYKHNCSFGHRCENMPGSFR
jgi:hypothetical protein